MRWFAIRADRSAEQNTTVTSCSEPAIGIPDRLQVILFYAHSRADSVVFATQQARMQAARSEARNNAKRFFVVCIEQHLLCIGAKLSDALYKTRQRGGIVGKSNETEDLMETNMTEDHLALQLDC